MGLPLARSGNRLTQTFWMRDAMTADCFRRGIRPVTGAPDADIGRAGLSTDHAIEGAGTGSGDATFSLKPTPLMVTSLHRR